VVNRRIVLNPPDIIQALKGTKSTNRVQQEASTNYIIAKYQPLIHKLAHSICPNCHIEDMLSAGNMAIIMAISNYNSRKSSFQTWAYTQIRDQLQKQRELEHPVKISRYLLKKGCTATYTQADREASYLPNPAQNLMAQEQLDTITEALRKIQKKLSKLHCTIFSQYYFEGKKLTELSKQYKCNAKYLIHQIIETLTIIKDEGGGFST
jgi:RNA polymerase sigma factor (sigma-70 family)